MIRSKTTLADYIKADELRYSNVYKSKLRYFLGLFIGEEQALVINYLKVFRKHEYYLNTSDKFLNRLFSHLYRFLHLRNCIKTNCWLYPNTIGPGVRIVHLGGRIGLNAKKIGKNLTVTAGVVVGKKNDDEHKATIGDNVELTLGCKVIGKVYIGDNVIVAPNSVVIKDVPSNSIASGVPVSIIKERKG